MKRRLTTKEHQTLIDALIREARTASRIASATMDSVPEEQTDQLRKSAEAQEALAAVLAEATIRVPRRSFDPNLDFLTRRDVAPEGGARVMYYTVIRTAADGQHSRTGGYRPVERQRDSNYSQFEELIDLIVESQRSYHGCIIVCTEKLVTEVFHVDGGGAITRVPM